jgi:carboxymethylenebutenolidase
MDIQTTTVTLPNGTPNLSGYFALPPGEGKFPAVVVIHEAYGLNDNIKEITGRFAEAGYATLAVDLFAGRNQMICMARFMTNLMLGSLDHAGIRDLKVALDWLEQHSKVDSGKIGAIGFLHRQPPQRHCALLFNESSTIRSRGSFLSSSRLIS